jgi:hypothetical protein
MALPAGGIEVETPPAAELVHESLEIAPSDGADQGLALHPDGHSFEATYTVEDAIESSGQFPNLCEADRAVFEASEICMLAADFSCTI